MTLLHVLWIRQPSTQERTGDILRQLLHCIAVLALGEDEPTHVGVARPRKAKLL